MRWNNWMAGIVTYVCRVLGVKDKSMLIFHEALNKPISLFKHHCIHSSISKYIYLINLWNAQSLGYWKWYFSSWASMLTIPAHPPNKYDLEIGNFIWQNVVHGVKNVLTIFWPFLLKNNHALNITPKIYRLPAHATFRTLVWTLKDRQFKSEART